MLCGLRGQQCFHTDGFLFLFFFPLAIITNALKAKKLLQ